MKNIIKKPILYLTLILSLGGFAGCSSKPKDDPAQVLNNYYENIKKSNITDVYEILSTVNKSNWTKEDFLKNYDYIKETYPLKDSKVEKVNEYTNKDINGEQYKNVIEFKITETVHDNYNDKDITHDYERYVVNESGSWKVYREQSDIKKNIAESMNNLARMYTAGKGENKDLNKSASILSEAITISADYSESYYLLGANLAELRRYDESISNIQEYLKRVTEDKSKSNAYNVLGLDYENKNDYAKAKENYNQAIQLDSNNQYAKTNLERVNIIRG